MKIENLTNALTGERNSTLKNILKRFIERAEINNYNGKLEFNLYIGREEQGEAYALANFDEYENSNALITHDLSSFKCNDLGGLISKLRLQ